MLFDAKSAHCGIGASGAYRTHRQELCQFVKDIMWATHLYVEFFREPAGLVVLSSVSRIASMIACFHASFAQYMGVRFLQVVRIIPDIAVV